VTQQLFSAFRFVALSAALAVLVGIAGPGCSSLDEPSSSGFASVTIKSRTAEEVAAATSEVFGAEGYRGGQTAPGKMVFEKEASRGTSLAREGIVAGIYGAQTINRVRVEIVPLAGGTLRLQCKAFMVTGGTDTFFQDEVPLTNARSRPYQSLLDKVAKQLNQAKPS
jgi:hypothetical protein